MSRLFGRLSRTPSTQSIKSNRSADNLPPKTHEIITTPPAGFTPKSLPALTPQEQAQAEELEQFIRAEAAANPPEESYKKHEQKWLDEKNLYQRYLRAGKGDLKESKKRIKATLEWRRDFKPDVIPFREVSKEGETGKQIVSGFDNDGRPLIYLRPGRENTQPNPNQVRFLVWHLERAIDLMPEGVHNYAVVIDYKSATSQSNPSLSTARHVMNILQNHYVERLGRAFVVNVPWFLNAFFSALTPFLDPVTKDKIKFNAHLAEYIPKDQLDSEFQGGQYNYEFEFDTYWKTLVDKCGLAEDGTRKEKAGEHEQGQETEEEHQQAQEQEPAQQEQPPVQVQEPVHPQEEAKGPAQPAQAGSAAALAALGPVDDDDTSRTIPIPAAAAEPNHFAVEQHADKLAADDIPNEKPTIGLGAAAGTTAALAAVVGGAAAAVTGAARTVAGAVTSSTSPYTYLQSKDDYEMLLSKYDTFLFDCDGVLWSGDETIPNVVSVLQKLRQRGKQVIFVTNNASKSRQTYLKKFAGMNIQAELDEVFSSSYASAVYLKKVLNFPADRKVYVIGMHGIEEELDAEGILHCGGTDPEDNKFLPALDFTSLQNSEAIDPKVGAVVCGFDMHMSYIKLAKAFKHLTRPGFDGPVEAGKEGGGCHFILTNDDSTFPAKGGPWPGAGSLSAPLVFATKRTPSIVGKPHKPMLDCIIATKQFDPSRAIMVGDRLNTDIEFGKAGGIATLLVLTGISKRDEIDAVDAKTVPDYLIDSLGDLDAVQ